MAVCRFDREIEPNRDMVGRLFPAPHVAIDAGVGEVVGGFR
jgi:hypothetical protein